MSARPSAAELIESIREFLERDVLDTEADALGGRTRFHMRVAVNALSIVQRELELGPALDAAELEGLRSVMGAPLPDDLADAPGNDPTTAGSSAHGDVSELDDLRLAFAAAIRDGSLDHRRAEVVAFIAETLRGTLSISKPGYDRPDDIGEADRLPGATHGAGAPARRGDGDDH